MFLKYSTILLFTSLAAIHFSCKYETEQLPDTSEFILQPDFRIELVAAEPLLYSPVAMQFDKKGRIWVVEMPGYMRDIDGSDEDLPDGKIVILSDEDHDGRMDKRKVFLDSLIAPRALAFAYNGLLYTNGTALWWAAIENDHPSEQELVDSLYVMGGNIEHQSNGLLYNLDNWIYSAKSNTRYKKKNGEWLKEATTARGQWGLTNDENGRLFYNDNSNPLMGDYFMPNTLTNNPFQEIKYGLNQQIATDRRVFPFQATAVNRGYEKEVLDENGKLKTFTSACGPLIYLGDQFPEEYYGNAFVCGPEVNLIKRYIIENDGEKINAIPAYVGEEFLVSKDETFRPVNLYTGLDGAIYIIDLRKGVIQHRAYMTSYLREKILEKGLDKTIGKGRIYRVVSNRKKLPPANFDSLLTRYDFPKLISHKNGAVRMMAQQEFINNGLGNTTNNLDQIVIEQFGRKQGLLHTLWAYEAIDSFHGINKLEDVAERVRDEAALIQMMRISNNLKLDQLDLLKLIKATLNKGSKQLDLQACLIIGEIENKEGENIWIKLASKYKNNSVFCEALISGISGREEILIDKIKHLKNDSIYSMLSQTILNKKNNDVKAPQLSTKTVLDKRTEGFKIYNTYCASCHGQDGKGNPQLAPPLYPSEYVSGPPERMILIALQGLKGPITVQGKKYEMNLVMPGIKNNPDLTDEKIASLMVFIKNSFTEGFPDPISPKMVKEIRASLESKGDEMFTEKSLEKWMEEHQLY